MAPSLTGPTSILLALLLLLAAAGAAWRGARLLARGLRDAAHPAGSLWLVRGLRGGIVALALAALAGGLLTGQGWLLVFGAIFLGEELYETGVLILVLRTGEAGDGGRRGSG
jgi:hypothetical protein